MSYSHNLIITHTYSHPSQHSSAVRIWKNSAEKFNRLAAFIPCSATFLSSFARANLIIIYYWSRKLWPLGNSSFLACWKHGERVDCDSSIDCSGLIVGFWVFGKIGANVESNGLYVVSSRRILDIMKNCDSKKTWPGTKSFISYCHWWTIDENVDDYVKCIKQ